MITGKLTFDLLTMFLPFGARGKGMGLLWRGAHLMCAAKLGGIDDGYCVCAKAIKFDPVASASWHKCLTAACASGAGHRFGQSKLNASAWIISFVAVICADSAVSFGDIAAERSFQSSGAAMRLKPNWGRASHSLNHAAPSRCLFMLGGKGRGGL